MGYLPSLKNARYCYGKLIVGLFVALMVFGASVTPTRGEQLLLVEVFYDPGCIACEAAESMIKNIEEEEYAGKIKVVWIDVGSQEGWRALQKYNLSEFSTLPIVVVDEEHVLRGRELNAKNMRAVIDAHLQGTATENPLLNQKFFIVTPVTAFLFGLFSGFSPCHMAILAFILVVSAEKGKGFAGGMARSAVFGLGLITAYFILGLTLLLFQGFPGIFTQYNLLFTLGLSIIFILTGLGLMNLIRLPVDTKAFIQRLMKTYGLSYAGMFLLGLFFALIKVPCATPFLLSLLVRISLTGLTSDLYLIAYFGLGVLMPLLGVGLVGGGSTYFAWKIRERYGRIFRLMGGLALIAMGVWFLI